MAEPTRIADILAASRAKVLVALGPTPGFEVWEKVQAIRDDLGDLEHVFSVPGPDGTADPATNFVTALDGQPGDRLVFEREFAANDTAAYVHSGGTTGAPKLARISHGGLVYKCWANSEIVAHRADDCMFSDYPMFHIAGFISRALLPFVNGATILIPSALGARSKTYIRNYWKLVERYRISYLSGVPTTLSVLLENPPDGEDISSFKSYAPTGSAALPMEISRQIERKLGVRMLATYGATELTQNATMIPRDGELRHGSTGIRLPHTHVKAVAVDAHGGVLRDCDADEIGVIAIKGPGVFPGYVDEALNEGLFFADGWFKSGDLGRVDADGYLWVTGRARDVIIRGGHNIDPSQIEEALIGHPAVQLAAAVGKPDARAGELPVAYVQLNAAVSEDQLKAFVRERITERAANPADIFIVDALPLTDIGKPNKVRLRDETARQAFEQILNPLATNGLAIEVAVGAHETAGTLSTVTLWAPAGFDRAAAEQAVHEALDPFAMRHEVVWK
jgi:fatty-acyl-CoA synthase